MKTLVNQNPATLPILDDGQFRLWTSLLYERAGILLTESRRVFLTSRLRTRMRLLGISDFSTYYRRVTTHINGVAEWQILLDNLTIHETHFFRHKPSYQLIAEFFMPRLVDIQHPPYTVNAWSIGCSTGEEPYSLAITLDQFFMSVGAKYYIGVTATDVSQTVLSTARRGVYPCEKIVNIDNRVRQTYFKAVDEKHYQVCSRIRRRVCFVRMNVKDIAQTPVGSMDIIFCQNLLIYFDPQKCTQLLETMVERLKPDGILLIGLGEMIGWSHPQVHRIPFADTQAYQHIGHKDQVKLYADG